MIPPHRSEILHIILLNRLNGGSFPKHKLNILLEREFRAPINILGNVSFLINSDKSNIVHILINYRYILLKLFQPSFLFPSDTSSIYLKFVVMLSGASVHQRDLIGRTALTLHKEGRMPVPGKQRDTKASQYLMSGPAAPL